MWPQPGAENESHPFTNHIGLEIPQFGPQPTPTIARSLCRLPFLPPLLAPPLYTTATSTRGYRVIPPPSKKVLPCSLINSSATLHPASDAGTTASGSTTDNRRTITGTRNVRVHPPSAIVTKIAPSPLILLEGTTVTAGGRSPVRGPEGERESLLGMLVQSVHVAVVEAPRSCRVPVVPASRTNPMAGSMSSLPHRLHEVRPSWPYVAVGQKEQLKAPT
jgi:hypothetical protein